VAGRGMWILITWSRVLGERLIVTQPVKKSFLPLMEPEGSLSFSQESATDPYPETLTSVTSRWILILLSHQILGFPSGLFLSLFHVFQAKFMCISHPPHSWYMFHHLIHNDFITITIFDQEYKLWSSSLSNFFELISDVTN